MSLDLGKENIYRIDTLLYELGDEVFSIAYVVEGVVRVENELGETTVGAGHFICVDDMFNQFYKADYYAEEGAVIMAFPAANLEEFISFTESSPQIYAKYYAAYCEMMEFMHNQYSILQSELDNVYNSLSNIYDRYLKCCNASGVAPAEFLMPHDASLFAFDKQQIAKNYMVFMNCYHSPGKLKQLYDKNPTNFMRQQLHIINDIATTYEDMVFYLKTTVSLLASKSQDCIFYLVSNLMEKADQAYAPMIMTLLNDMKTIITNMDKHILDSTGIVLDIDYNRVNFYFMVANNSVTATSNTSVSAGPDSSLEVDTDNSVSDDTSYEEDNYTDFTDNIFNLCRYANLETDFGSRLYDLISSYLALSDKSSREDDVRKLKKDISELYFILYEEVFFAYTKDFNPPMNVQLFLDFGVLDERLISEEDLSYLPNIPTLTDNGPCKVYRMSDWLMAIFRGEKMPSKNELDMDYADYVRSKKNEEHLSAAKEQQLLENSTAKVQYEIRNLLKYSCRILSGNMLSFTPMLSKFDYDGELAKYILDAEIVNDAVNSVLAVDYSAFYREQLYADSEKKIDKEVIQIQVFPDIILFPVYGVNSLMWQDLSGKRSNTPGRFLFPAFYRGDIKTSMISIIGRFRWELCKSLMGTAWNNVLVHSLTSEYSDYIQFYRKNKDLSAEKKEALKNQISHCRNNMREVFASDYLVWIKFESSGAIRLNKVARSILATYCPFSKELREKVKGQPIFDDAMRKFTITHQKKIHELDLRMRNLIKNGAEITPEILETEKFYKM